MPKSSMSLSDIAAKMNAIAKLLADGNIVDATERGEKLAGRMRAFVLVEGGKEIPELFNDHMITFTRLWTNRAAHANLSPSAAILGGAALRAFLGKLDEYAFAFHAGNDLAAELNDIDATEEIMRAARLELMAADLWPWTMEAAQFMRAANWPWN